MLLNLRADGPLHARLTDAVREAIRDGRVHAGSRLPSSRSMAAELGCSRWVVTEAYGQLAAEGYLDGQTGSGTRVRMDGVPAAAAAPARAGAANAAIDLAPGLPDLRAFPVTRWVAAVRAAAAAMPVADLGYPEQAGHPVLRDVLSGYLTRVRGARANPADLTVCASVREGIARLCAALREAGRRAVAVEDPGRHGAVRAAPGRAACLGAAHRRADHRGRLRRRIPVRPAAGRRAAGRRPGCRRAARLGQQDPVAGARHRLDAHPAGLDGTAALGVHGPAARA
ncbi:MAG TPA: GntR family transcriptional regulator [Streptosporangiaceae bacterium]|nr:GntR family transcriptional regulator [Streptosporangiaceae bacterium]